MKALKTILIATILIFALTSTQQVQAQTKEETIAWIKEKLEKYSNNWGTFSSSEKGARLNVTPCSIQLTYYDYWGGVDNAYHYTAFDYFPTREVLSVGLNDDEDRVVIKLGSASGKSFHWFFTGRSDDARSPIVKEISIINGEANLAQRMEKALKHLATFCDEGKNEAF